MPDSGCFVCVSTQLSAVWFWNDRGCRTGVVLNSTRVQVTSRPASSYPGLSFKASQGVVPNFTIISLFSRSLSPARPMHGERQQHHPITSRRTGPAQTGWTVRYPDRPSDPPLHQSLPCFVSLAEQTVQHVVFAGLFPLSMSGAMCSLFCIS